MSEKAYFDASLREVLKNLDQLPAKIEANIVRGALRASAKPIVDSAKQNVPEETGALRDSIRISSSIDKKKGDVRIQVKAGKRGKKGDPYYAHMVEFGTLPHLIKGPIFFNGEWRQNVYHPGTRPNGFMRRAFDTTADAVIAAYAAYMRKRIPRELAKHGSG